MILNDRIQLFNDHKLLYLGSKIKNQLLRKRIDHTQLQNAGIIPEHFLGILIAGGRGDDADLRISHLYPVKLTVFRISDELSGTLLHNRMTADSVTRHHNVLGNILHIWFRLRHHSLARLHHALGMSHSGTHLDDDRCIKLFGKLKCFLGKLIRLS